MIFHRFFRFCDEGKFPICATAIVRLPPLSFAARERKDYFEFVFAPALNVQAKLISFFPICQWLPQYQRAWLGDDLVAGATLAAYAIPVSLAYAALAGLPPQMGLYCYLVGGLGYALLGSSRHLAYRSLIWPAAIFKLRQPWHRSRLC